MEKLTLELDQRFSNGYDFAPKGHLAILETFLIVTTGKKGIAADIKWVENSDPSAMHRTTPLKQRIIQLEISIVPS